MEIIPAILTDSPTKFKELVRKLEPYTKRIHIDIADGEFVPSKTVNGFEEVKDIEASTKFDVHLMVKKPQEIIKEWLYTHADRFIIHAEAEVDLGEIIKIIKDHDRKVGIALNPETGFEKIEKYLGDVDFIHFMTVYPGFQGGTFVDEVVDKISAFHNKYPDIIIMSDGAVALETASRVAKAGATLLVSGSFIIKSNDFAKAIEELKKSCTTL